MRIAQLVLPGASAYERKSQLLDAHALGERITENRDEADLVHVYGPREIPPAAVTGFRLPYVASGIVRKPRFAWRAPREPEYALSPVESDDFTLLPEAVDDAYFGNQQQATGNYVIGSMDRPSTQNIIAQTFARIHRFRDDVTWHLFTHQPSPAELAQLFAWIDPAVE